MTQPSSQICPRPPMVIKSYGGQNQTVVYRFNAREMILAYHSLPQSEKVKFEKILLRCLGIQRDIIKSTFRNVQLVNSELSELVQKIQESNESSDPEMILQDLEEARKEREKSKQELESTLGFQIEQRLHSLKTTIGSITGTIQNTIYGSSIDQVEEEPESHSADSQKQMIVRNESNSRYHFQVFAYATVIGFFFCKAVSPP